MEAMRWMRQELAERRRRAEELREANAELLRQRSEWLKERGVDLSVDEIY